MTTADSAPARVETAYEFLLEEILSFRVRTGAPLSENRIASQLGISRTPVREALQRLEKEGLVTRSDNARFSVMQLTPKQAHDACDLLEVLDTYIATRAARSMTPADHEPLRAAVAAMRRAAQSGEREAWSDADLAYHRFINALAGNELVAETVRATRRRVQRFWLRAAAGEHRLEDCSEEHRVLAEAMIAKDYDAIAPAVEVHVGHMRERILHLLESAAAVLGG